MALPVPPKPRSRRWLGILAVLLLLMLPIGVVFGPIIAAMISIATDEGVSQAVPADETVRMCEVTLRDWKLFGPDDQITDRMHFVNGWTKSDGWHGDGEDWYEVDLSPDLAADLRTKLTASTVVKKEVLAPDVAWNPPWWPTAWPADARIYADDGEFKYLILPDTGTHAWVLWIRT